ncbi:MAG: ABC transporter ATP-binding protein [Nocardioides sp.]|nr:ABC transporter ATP-binding protein [Nocardioides sp.]
MTLTDPSELVGSAIRVEACSRTYETPGGVPIRALDQVSVDFPAGTVTAVCGPSGSGKSTLLHLIGGMDKPDSGLIWADEHQVTAMSSSELVRYRRTVGFVFQSFALLPALTARDNVMLPVLPYRSGKQDLDRAGELLADVGLAGREDAVPSHLSGGQRQRVAIARALMGNPRLLVADEPTGNLDSTTGREIVDLLFALRDTRGLTIVIGTHDESLAARCDRTVRLHDGRIVRPPPTSDS